MLVPAWVCFAATSALRLGASSPILLKLGLATGLLQVPATALAMLLILASAMGELFPRARFRLLYTELAVASAAITLVFFWRGVYRR